MDSSKSIRQWTSAIAVAALVGAAAWAGVSYIAPTRQTECERIANVGAEGRRIVSVRVLPEGECAIAYGIDDGAIIGDVRRLTNREPTSRMTRREQMVETETTVTFDAAPQACDCSQSALDAVCSKVTQSGGDQGPNQCDSSTYYDNGTVCGCRCEGGMPGSNFTASVQKSCRPGE